MSPRPDRLLLLCLLHATAVLLLSGSVASAEDGWVYERLLLPQPGEKFHHGEFSCWIPDTTDPLRGVLIHQHGCTNASPEAHPPVTLDFHWRALARKHHFALLSPQYQVAGSCDEWNNPESGSERALFSALEEIGRESARPELGELPWVLWGHSGGSSWSSQMILRYPERILAASFRGGCHRQFGDAEFRARFGPVARELPLLFVWGKRESVPTSRHHVSWEPMNTMYRELRRLGGTVARVIDPRSEHGCDDSRLLVIPFFDAVLTAWGKGEAPLGTLRDIASLERRAIDETTRVDPALTWLPNEAVADLWREFSESGTLVPDKGPSTAPRLFAKRETDGQVRLSWSLVPELAGGVRSLRLYRDGRLWQEIGPEPGEFLATARDAPPEGLRALPLLDREGATHQRYGLRFLDAAGQESPLAEVEVR